MKVRFDLKKVIIIFGCLLILSGFNVVSFAEDEPDKKQVKEPAADSIAKVEDNKTSDKFVAYYFHSTKRCFTCKKLEAYAGEAFSSGFAEELADSTLVWQPINYDEKENKHFIKDYKLYTKALILSRIRDGEEIDWVNLENIWQLVGNKEKYIEYVQAVTRKFMDSGIKDE
jgi:hypothetical protein